MPLPLEERAILAQAAEERVEDQQAVRATHGILAGALRMRHETEHGPFLVDDARDVVERAVGIGVLDHAAVLAGVAEHDLPLIAETAQGLRVGVELPLAVRDR